ncbi:unnamed protein product [Aphanomyces euteiches]|uniref:Uncharacterized protein n=1 Tax=Aphanomyces euteiches TaxID=100861 RepID=A0A6G0WLF4_9STRA|nr:hypothetical protein Ae201684_013958 [Aphanomyces euteiches]KAH9083077.1 hypothetical protein Ae201684P_013978 [Aphanomyces euteiches]
MLGGRVLRHVRRLTTKIDKPETKPTSLFLQRDETLTTRIMGSDWADRRGQPVTFSMKLYWTIFGLVIANGVYAHYTGQDEFAVYDNVKKSLFGQPETKEHEFVGAAEQKAAAEETVKQPQPEENKVVQAVELPAKLEPAAGPMANHKATTPPVFGLLSRAPSPARPVLTKEQLISELAALRQQEKESRLELKRGSHRDMDVIATEIREIELLKAELKRRIKKLQ